jgi:hypothetical protein
VNRESLCRRLARCRLCGRSSGRGHRGERHARMSLPRRKGGNNHDEQHHTPDDPRPWAESWLIGQDNPKSLGMLSQLGRCTVPHRKSEFDSRARPALLGIFSHWQSSDRRVGMRFHCRWPTSREETLGIRCGPLPAEGTRVARCSEICIRLASRQPRIRTHYSS